MRARPAALIVAALALSAARADGQAEIYTAMGIRPGDVMQGSILQAKVVPGGEKQTVAMVTFLTGKKDEAMAVDVRLEVFRREAGKMVPVYSRDFGAENGGYVGRGELELVDLDNDGLAEIVVSYDNAKSKTIDERRGEVIVRDPDAFRTAWSGSLSYDATKAAREVPADRRDRFTRRLDIPATLKTRGITLIMTKTVIAVAGERLPEPKQVQETYPLRGETP